jgi:hypothetical protein
MMLIPYTAHRCKGVKNMHITVDRFEGAFAIIETPDGSTYNVPKTLFPGAVEGDVFVISKADSEKTKRQNRIQDKFNNLKKQ